MRLLELLIGRPLRSEEEWVERIGVLTGIPLLGLDALASASYGPEAALAELLLLAGASTIWIGPITLAIVALLILVALSYSQTIAACALCARPGERREDHAASVTVIVAYDLLFWEKLPMSGRR